MEMDNQEIARFFLETPINVHDNFVLREPQREGYGAIVNHFTDDCEPGYVLLPVGSGKTGLMGITPFGVSEGRVLIVAPNLVIRKTILDELDISDSNNFYVKRGVFTPKDGPFVSELKRGANIHDCDGAHIVVANIQQFAGKNNKWYERFDPDYFRMILIDEGHHNVAKSWRRMIDYFSGAKVVSYTGTPMRADGQRLHGKRIYSFGYTRSMMMGYISPIDSVYVSPEVLEFTTKEGKRTLSLAQVLEMREQDWFSRGIAMSETCSHHIVQASIHRLQEVRKHGAPRQIIAAACSIRHAEMIRALYHQHGLKAEVLHSKLTDDKRSRVEQALRSGLIDVVVQVQILGEGYSLGTLSVAAIFRPYRSLSPYIQFIGRILRLADPQCPGSPGNRVYVVSHVGLNDARWWDDFSNFDVADQAFVREYLAGDEGAAEEEGEGKRRLSLRPFMRVLNETVEKYVQKAYLREVDRAMLDDLMQTIREKGFEPGEFGLTAEMLEARIRMTGQQQLEFLPYAPPVQPQRTKEALRIRLAPEARAIADAVLNRLDLEHRGRDLLRHFPGKGSNNAHVLVALASARQNARMGIEKRHRDEASIDQLRTAVDASADITDQLTALVKDKMNNEEEQ